jgi:hypothetical protein
VTRVTTIDLRPLTTANLARLLEQQAGAILLAVIEASGHDPAEGWTLRLDGAHLERTGPAQGAAPPEGRGDGAIAAPSKGETG